MEKGKGSKLRFRQIRKRDADVEDTEITLNLAYLMKTEVIERRSTRAREDSGQRSANRNQLLDTAIVDSTDDLSDLLTVASQFIR